MKPNRLRGVDCDVEVVEVRPNPSCDQRTATVPKPIRARLRTAWKATCGSSEHAWTQISPRERCGSSWSPGKCGRSRSASGRRSASPNRSRPRPSRNIPGPKPKVIVRPPGARPIASPVSSGGARGAPSVGPIGPAGRPWVIRSAARVHAFSSATSWARECVVMSNAAKWSRSWAGVTMPAWCVPRKGYVVARGGASPPRPSAYASADSEAGGHPGDGRAAADQAASRDLHPAVLRAAPPPSGATAARRGR